MHADLLFMNMSDVNVFWFRLDWYSVKAWLILRLDITLTWNMTNIVIHSFQITILKAEKREVLFLGSCEGIYSSVILLKSELGYNWGPELLVMLELVSHDKIQWSKLLAWLYPEVITFLRVNGGIVDVALGNGFVSLNSKVK